MGSQLFVLVWSHLISPALYLGDYFVRKISIFVLDFVTINEDKV